MTRKRLVLTKPGLQYRPVAEVWEREKKLAEEVWGHVLGSAERTEVNFCGAVIAAPCLKCGLVLQVHGGWGGGGAFGACAHVACK